MLRKIVGLALMTTLAACGLHGKSEQMALTDAVATDLPDDGRTDKPVELYWVTDTQLFRGRCNDRDVLLRSQCTNDLQSMRYDDFKRRLDGGLSDTIRELQAEARRIQDAIVAIQTQIQAVLAELARIEHDHGQLSQELAALRTKMQQFETIVVEYREQLRLIDIELQRAVDHDMQELRVHVMNQLGKYQEQLSQIGGRVGDLMRQLADLQGQLDQLRRQADALNVRLSNMQNDLAVVEAKLKGAYDDFEVYEETLRKLQSGIVHPILSDNPWWQKERQFVKRFDKIFE